MPRAELLSHVMTVYCGSDADATRALYERLGKLGSQGLIAVNLLRAQKSSSRAKIYRGGGFRGKAYDKKQWAMGQLCDELARLGALEHGLTWGWQQDPRAPVYKWVLYIDLPNGQVSFHSPTRGDGPDYLRSWDGVPQASAARICTFAATLLHQHEEETCGAA